MNRKLRIGDIGDDVRAVQDVLNFHIRRLTPLKVDGKFGPKTDERVQEFQRINALQVDGIVGKFTNEKLFEIEVVPFSLAIVPTLLLTPPKFGATPAGITPPRLIPPLVLPGPPFTTPFQLLPSSLSPLPPLTSRGQLLTLTLTAPSRNDPADPALRSFQQIVQLLETLPPNFPFRTSIIGAVPNPVKRIGDIGFGFRWGVDPVFDVTKLGSPVEFVVGAKGNASYTLKVINQPGPGGIKIGFFGKGDFKGEFDFTSTQATSRPQLRLQGSIFVGLEGRF